MIDVGGTVFRDKVLGCWIGKNCGGTLGGPLEEPWGRSEPFDVSWYPALPEGGIPNDDLEIQLIWLKALEERGLELTAEDLAEYWQDHVRYNLGEYGFSRANLRLGLRPPVSGAFNNWFADGMGAPIRSEIWACLCPGAPRLAARYAIEDAICDHGGGEGLWGELFNATMQSAAFVESDRHRLVAVGRSYLPDDCACALAVDVARSAFDQGADWLTARRRVLEAVPNPVAQYAPINIGFQIIAWLWGRDFGHAICMAVNCGYDTDCTAATVGALYGIVYGASGLPRRWVEPLGRRIATNEANGGVVHLSDGPNPAPGDVDELTERVVHLARRRMAGVSEADCALDSDEATRAHAARPPMRMVHRRPGLTIEVDYGCEPVAVPGEARLLTVRLRNQRPEPIICRPRLNVPDRWRAEADVEELTIPAEATAEVVWKLTVPGPGHLDNTQRLVLDLAVEDRPAVDPVTVTMIGARRFRSSGPYPVEADNPAAALARAMPPEALVDDPMSERGRGGQWHYRHAAGNALPLEGLDGPGVIYLQGFIHCDTERAVQLCLHSSCPVRLWLNGKVVAEETGSRPIRPVRATHGEVTLRFGFNELLIKVARLAGDTPAETHLMFVDGPPVTDLILRNYLVDLGWTRMPWD